MNKVLKQIAICSLLIVMLVLQGCPLKTKNSPDDGSFQVPAWLMGKWSEINSAGKKVNGYLLKTGDKLGTIECLELDSAGTVKGTEAKRIIMSNIGDKIFLSVFEAADDLGEEGYYIFEFRKVSNKEFTIAGVKENSVDYEESAEGLKKFLAENKDNQEIYPMSEMSRYKKQD